MHNRENKRFSLLCYWQDECKGGFCLAHAMKHTRAASGHMFRHYERATDENGEYVKFGNQNIDTNFSGSNINFAPKRDISQGEFVRQRCAEVRMQNRKDVNVMCSWVVTLPDKINTDETLKFFGYVYGFLADRYGRENVVSAYVHRDESKDHMHFAFVPVVEDKKRGGYKVSAKEAIDRKELQTFHKDLDIYMTKIFGRDIGILNEATKDGNKSIEELKRSTALERISEANRQANQIIKNASHEAKELINMARETQTESCRMLENARERVEKAQSGIETLEVRKRVLERKIEGLEYDFNGRVLKINELTTIQPQRTLTGAIKGIRLEDIQNLKQTVVMSLKTLESVESLSQDNERLARKCETLEKQQPSIMDKMKEAQEKTRLQEIEKAFQRLPEDIQKQLLQGQGKMQKQWHKR